MSLIQNSTLKTQNKIDAAGQMFLPCWCDSHTHLVFASSREEEFVDKKKE
jgi:imidazolonepropionase